MAERQFYLTAWREHRGLSKSELARIVGTTHSRISEIESGSERYNETILVLCAQALGVRPAILLLGPPEGISGLVALLDQIDESQTAAATAMLRGLADHKPLAFDHGEPTTPPRRKRTRR